MSRWFSSTRAKTAWSMPGISRRAAAARGTGATPRAAQRRSASPRKWTAAMAPGAGAEATAKVGLLASDGIIGVVVVRGEGAADADVDAAEDEVGNDGFDELVAGEEGFGVAPGGDDGGVGAVALGVAVEHDADEASR